MTGAGEWARTVSNPLTGAAFAPNVVTSIFLPDSPAGASNASRGRISPPASRGAQKTQESGAAHAFGIEFDLP